MRAISGLTLAVVLSGCSVVKMQRVRDDWPTAGAPSVKRLQLVVQPLPLGNEKVAELFGKVARRYVHMKRDFLMMGVTVSNPSPPMGALCGEGRDGVLWLKPTVLTQGDGFEASIELRLFRCSDGAEQWGADAGGSFPAKDSGLAEVAKNYAQELGPEVERYVPLAMNLLRPPLDTLPQPKLTDADVEEKMGLDE
ncbi:MAG: MXAN_6521/LA_1396 family lipoprotein [Myxococcaceae bacterium]|nr:MXAN_6521/LA_1396 family lipoprotein [Myxococcaceae bacterium]